MFNKAVQWCFHSLVCMGLGGGLVALALFAYRPEAALSQYLQNPNNMAQLKALLPHNHLTAQGNTLAPESLLNAFWQALGHGAPAPTKATVNTPAAGPKTQDTLGLLGLFPTKHWGNNNAGKDKLISMAVVPIELEPKALFVEALVNNQEKGHFILDTGATYMSISKDMAEGMHLDLAHADKVPITTANGRIEVPKVVLSTVNVNGIEAHNVEATVMNFRKEASFSGLLGLSFINQFKLTIDPAKGQMMFEPLETAQAKP